MFSILKDAVVVKRGICNYDNAINYEVRIVKWHTLYGTGDYEDLPEIRDDKEIECFYVLYENIISKGNFNTGGGGFLSVEEAVFSVENKIDVKWI